MPSLSTIFSRLPIFPPASALLTGMLAAYFLPALVLWRWSIIIAAVLVLLLVIIRNSAVRQGLSLVIIFFVGTYLMTRALAACSAVYTPGKQTLTATIVDTPRRTEQRIACQVYVHDGPLKGKQIRLYFPTTERENLSLADTYTVSAYLYPFENDFKSRNLNFVRWAQSHGLAAEGTVYSRSDYSLATKQLAEQLPLGTRILVHARQYRAVLLRLLADEQLPVEEYTLLAAMALGERNTLPSSTRALFTQTGVSHLLALSGLHITIFYLLLVGRRRGGNTLRRIIAMTTIWLYVVLVGMPVSALRAALMLTVFTLFSLRYQEPGQNYNSLIVIAVLFLLWRPLLLWDMSLQLSLLAVLSIMLFYPPIYALVSRRWLDRYSLVRELWSLVGVSLAATIGTMPLVLYYFGYVAPYLVLTNIIAVPLVTAVLYLVVATFVLWALTPLRHLLLFAIHGLLTFLTTFLHVIAALPGAHIDNCYLSPTQLIGAFLLVALLLLALRRLAARRARSFSSRL